MENFFLDGYFGFYSSFYVRTVYLHEKATNDIYNFFTIATAIEEQKKYKESNEKFGKLNSEYNYGFKSHFKSFDWVKTSINSIVTKNSFLDNGTTIKINNTQLVERQFLSHLTDQELFSLSFSKFNSYIFEFIDVDKTRFYDLISDDLTYEKLMNSLLNIEFKLNEVPDRIGNFVIEFPNGLIKETKRSNKIDINIIWDSRIKEQNQSVYILNKESSKFKEIFQLKNDTIIFTERKKQQLFELLDSNKNLLILDGHNCKEFFQLMISVHPILQKKRAFSNGSDSIAIKKYNYGSSLVDQIDDAALSLRKFRNLSTIRKNMSELKYKQYGIDSNLSSEALAKSAIEDLVQLIKNYGGAGVWIWDPYVSADDIINLIINNYEFTSQIKILGSKKRSGQDSEIMDIVESDSAKNKREQWFSKTKIKLEEHSDNYGLNLEFRCAFGTKKSNFHDRFIIFPEVGYERECKAWSLGISLNQFGKAHHVLQEVNFPDYIKTAFEHLWKESNQVDRLVFKCECMSEE